MTATTIGSKNWKDPTYYRHEDDVGTKQRPANRIDYRPIQGPLLQYVWCQDSVLSGQNLYLGAEMGGDGNMYCIPGHADRVMMVDPSTDVATLIGPVLAGKYKWLRGVVAVTTSGDDDSSSSSIYGLPCHADTVLKIHVPTRSVTVIPIQYDEFFPGDPEAAALERHQKWKYHGGNTSPVDGCIYAIPQSARYVLKVDPTTDQCTLVGPALPGKYKWYGGVVGKVDGALYGIPHNSPHVLRIHPHDETSGSGGVTLHGDFGSDGHKWHGAAAAPNGAIVCVAANADTVLCIIPQSPAPILMELGDASILQSGRHRKDAKYKFLGAVAGPDGRVYCFPCAAERVLAVDVVNMTGKSLVMCVCEVLISWTCKNQKSNV